MDLSTPLDTPTPEEFHAMKTDRKPWTGEFPNEDPRDMDAAAIRILLATIRAGQPK